jgi:hypothetical protein
MKRFSVSNFKTKLKALNCHTCNQYIYIILLFYDFRRLNPIVVSYDHFKGTLLNCGKSYTMGLWDYVIRPKPGWPRQIQVKSKSNPRQIHVKSTSNPRQIEIERGFLFR